MSLPVRSFSKIVFKRCSRDDAQGSPAIWSFHPEDVESERKARSKSSQLDIEGSSLY
jgi:hypothetical protein